MFPREGKIKWVEGPSGFLEDGENQSKAGEERKIPLIPGEGAGSTLPPVPPFLTSSLELPEPLPAYWQVWEKSYVHLDGTLRLEFVSTRDRRPR